MIPPPCWCFNYLPAIRMSLMLHRHPMQHPPGVEMLFPVGNALGMAAENFTVIVPCVTPPPLPQFGVGFQSLLLIVCSDSRLLMLLVREGSTPQGST